MVSPLLSSIRSSVGQKIAMALSGVFLIVFIIAHLLGNLEIFSGREAVNHYGVLLRQFPKALWSIRLLLVVSFITHIATAISLANKNKKAKAISYQVKRYRQTTLASRTMLIGGLVVLFFLLYHLAHFTWGLTHPEHAALLDAQGRHDTYGMVVLGFQSSPVALFYLLAQVFLTLHLSHGFSSAAQTLGLTNRTLATLLKRVGILFSITVFTLYSSIPISVWLGLITF